MVDEKDIDDLLKKARTLLSQRRLDDAQSTAEIALSMLAEQDIEKLVRAHLILGEVYKERGEWEKAEEHFRKAAELYRENLDALFGLVRSLEPQKTSEKKRE
jgi:tetratricopeptide (TPR) repeat protein